MNKIETGTAVITEFVEWRSPNRKVLQLAYPGSIMGTPFQVILPCGNVRIWKKETIPEQSVECRCGDLPYRHWFIKYDEAD